MTPEQTQHTDAEQVLEFRLGDERYCVSIDAVVEIVDMGSVTPVPNAPPHVEGIIDLRGTTTSIIDPKVGLDVDGDLGDRVVIFDPAIFDDERSIGWAVDRVEEVAEIGDSPVDDAPIDGDYIRGLIRRESGFVVWIDPRHLDDVLNATEGAAISVGQQ